MSECVVRMEMPKACWFCGLRFVCKAANDFMTTKEAGCSVLKVGMEGCLIVCQLPEEHGRLVDMRDIDLMMENASSTSDESGLYSLVYRDDLDFDELPTIVPAERSGDK